MTKNPSTSAHEASSSICAVASALVSKLEPLKCSQQAGGTERSSFKGEHVSCPNASNSFGSMASFMEAGNLYKMQVQQWKLTPQHVCMQSSQHSSPRHEPKNAAHFLRAGGCLPAMPRPRCRSKRHFQIPFLEEQRVTCLCPRCFVCGAFSEVSGSGYVSFSRLMGHWIDKGVSNPLSPDWSNDARADV